jgi:glycosyltransferase involved in cell wall biosynthesis
MRIIHITPSYKPAYVYGGPTISVALLCEGLLKLKVNLIVFTTTANGDKDFESEESITQVENVNVIYFNRFLKGQLHLSFSLLKKLVDSTRKQDILHIHSWWNATAILSALVGVIRGNKVVISPRGMLTSYSLTNRQILIKKLFQIVIGRWLLNQCLIHVTSEKERQDVLQFINHARVIIIPNVAENLNTMGSQQVHQHYPSCRLKLLFLSRIERKKGIEMLLLALSRIGFEYHLTIAGSGNQGYIRHLKSEITRLKLQESVKWIGFVEPKNKVEILTTHDLLVLFSYNENFANVVVESLSLGLPVAVSDGVGLADFVIEHDLGWVCRNCPIAIASLLETAFLDVEKRLQISKAAPKLIKHHFDEKAISSRYLAMYLNYES